MSITLVRDDAAPAKARWLLRQFAPDLPDARLSDAVLAVSELVTSALSDGVCDIAVSAVRVHRTVRIEIADRAAPSMPDRKRRRILGAVADRWGVDGDRQRLWFEVDVPAARAGNRAGRARKPGRPAAVKALPDRRAARQAQSS